MVDNKDLQIRDPFVLPLKSEGNYYLFGSTDKNIWEMGTGFDMYVGTDLQQWDGPFPAFRPDPSFYSEKNFWAPEVYAYRNKYYMFATFRRKDNDLLGTAVLIAETPRGPFLPYSEGPVTPKDWSSLDGTLYIDNEQLPWMVFCHEWQQVKDGQVCAVRLSEDLKVAVGEPIVLFSASEAAWATPFISKRYPNQENYVTDGTYLFRDEEDQLQLLWASFIDNTYALGIARSESGELTGPWIHQEEALYQNDGGHAMVFKTFEDKLLLAIHTPNQTPNERPFFLELEQRNGKIMMKD
ncbi:MAG: glycoside hydrolase family 43 protein [Gorillibacterium sp.]|nr:glycoside hydrolase family 43 protein [Gorillibacterium sp.]